MMYTIFSTPSPKQCEDDEQHRGMKNPSEGSAEVNILEE